jgi:hypothetical protein
VRHMDAPARLIRNGRVLGTVLSRESHGSLG